VSSLQDELNSTQSQLSDTQSSLNATQSTLSQAQGTISSLSQQLTATQTSLSDANSQLSSASSQLSDANSQLSQTQTSLSSANSQNSNLSTQLSQTQTSLSSANGQISSLQDAVTSANGQVTTLQGQLSTATGQVSSLTTQATNLTSVADALTTLGAQEAACLEAAVETIIPSDSTGPGAKEAGVLFFLDKQLAGEYGKAGNMFMQAPYVLPGIAGPITVDGITYSAGTMAGSLASGYGYQYGMNFRTFWRYAVLALESYSTTAYGGAFETLPATTRAQVLTDLAGNKPASSAFNDINASDFFLELFFMTWCGFLMDPMHGGNRGLVGWTYTGFNGVNQGDFYGEGHTTMQLMVASTPTLLKPVSLAQFQAEAGYTAGAGGD
jgi:gluconate 2-dehydrogenase gamma chain